MTVEETIQMLRRMPPQAEFACVLGCGRKFVAKNLTRIQLIHRDRTSKEVVKVATDTTEPVVGIIVW